MITLGLVLLANMLIWSIVFFFLRKLASTKTNGPRHLPAPETHTGNMTARSRTILPSYSLFLILALIVFFTPGKEPQISDRASGVVFILIMLLSYLYLLRAFFERDVRSRD